MISLNAECKFGRDMKADVNVHVEASNGAALSSSLIVLPFDLERKLLLSGVHGSSCSGSCRGSRRASGAVLDRRAILVRMVSVDAVRFVGHRQCHSCKVAAYDGTSEKVDEGVIRLFWRVAGCRTRESAK